MGDFDQNRLASLWDLENEGMQDQRTSLDGERYVSLFLNKLNGRSYIFEHGGESANDGTTVGDAEYQEFDSSDQAQMAYDALIEMARQDGAVVEEDSTDELGDPETDGPVLTETGTENLDNDDSDSELPPPEEDLDLPRRA